ncbi:MAG: IS200/IS605 family transposase [Pyrinomonadaceae bacterium MAG19_C2-C3]|nr:IS200/IS605 family transposase [Pyrinomonadaceae bacterium MAG19_C2-C3]
MAHTYTNLLTHIIFSTKQRQQFINDDIKPRLHSYIGGIVRELDGIAYNVGGIADHVHILVSLKPVLAMSDAVRTIKTNSSRWLKQQNATLSIFEWQSGYGAFSVSQSNMKSVVKYIAAQEEHHRTRTFQEEYLMFLKRHGIDYDERYVFD